MARDGFDTDLKLQSWGQDGKHLLQSCLTNAAVAVSGFGVTGAAKNSKRLHQSGKHFCVYMYDNQSRNGKRGGDGDLDDVGDTKGI